MPFRIPSRAPATGARGSLRTFTTTPRLATFHEPTDSHYDVLKVRPEASEAEIKKQVPVHNHIHFVRRRGAGPSVRRVLANCPQTDPSTLSPSCTIRIETPQTPTRPSASSASRRPMPSSPPRPSAPPTTASSAAPTTTPTAALTTTRPPTLPAGGRPLASPAGARTARAEPSAARLTASTSAGATARMPRSGGPRTRRARAWAAWGSGRTRSIGPTRRILTGTRTRGHIGGRTREGRAGLRRQGRRGTREGHLVLRLLLGGCSSARATCRMFSTAG